MLGMLVQQLLRLGEGAARRSWWVERDDAARRAHKKGTTTPPQLVIRHVTSFAVRDFVRGNTYYMKPWRGGLWVVWAVEIIT